MALIFTGSADSHSAERVSRLLEPVLRWLFPDITQETLETAELLARKCGHLTEYAVLAILSWCALRGSSAPGVRLWDLRQVAIVLFVVLVYASSDEWHQSMVPTRIGTPVDVVIDLVGGAAGLGALWAGNKLVQRWRGRRLTAPPEPARP